MIRLQDFECNTLTDFAYLFDRGFPQGQRLNFLRFAASKSTKRIYSWLKLYLLFSCMHLLTDAHHLLGQSCWCHCVFVWAHGLLFVVGAMCSPVYCLTPHFLLSHYCFSVFLVCLPMYFPGVCSPMRFRCLTSLCVMFACAAVLLLGWVLFLLIIKRPTFHLHLSPCLISPHASWL